MYSTTQSCIIFSSNPQVTLFALSLNIVDKLYESPAPSPPLPPSPPSSLSSGLYWGGLGQVIKGKLRKSLTSTEGLRRKNSPKFCRIDPALKKTHLAESCTRSVRVMYILVLYIQYCTYRVLMKEKFYYEHFTRVLKGLSHQIFKAVLWPTI